MTETETVREVSKSRRWSESRSATFTSYRKPSMTTKLYGKDLSEYDDVDIDSLLAKLTPAELEELNNEVDPDNSLLPASQRCRDQTTKSPTGPYNREKLLKFLEEKAKNEKDWEEKVPFQAGLKRGKVFVPKVEEQENVAVNEIPFDLENDSEIELALSEAGEADLVDLAGILGMHSLISQTQYYNAVKGTPQEDEEKTFSGVVKSSSVKQIPDEPPNDTDVADCIKRLKANDSSLNVVNVNNMKEIPREDLRELIAAAKESSSLETFTLANTALTDADAKGLIGLLKTSKSLKNLNVESNYLTGEMLASLLRATLDKQILVEFHAENQRSALLGVKIEMELAKIIEENETLLRVGISFDTMEARYRVAEAVESNYERVRLERNGLTD